MDKNESKVYEIFEELNITDYVVHEHPAIFSTEDSDRLGLAMEGINVKNLLIHDKKQHCYFLVIIDEHRHMDMNHFKSLTGWKKVSFAKEDELWEVLQLKPGSVTALAMFNDIDHRVTVVLDSIITNADPQEKISFHPCRNNATLTMRTGDFIGYLNHLDTTIIFEP